MRFFLLTACLVLIVGTLAPMSFADADADAPPDTTAVVPGRMQVDRFIGYHDDNVTSGYQILLQEEGFSEDSAKINADTFYGMAQLIMAGLPETSDAEVALQQGDMTAFMLYILIHNGTTETLNFSESMQEMDRPSPAFYDAIDDILPGGLSDAFLARRSGSLFDAPAAPTPQPVPPQKDREGDPDMVDNLLQMLQDVD